MPPPEVVLGFGMTLLGQRSPLPQGCSVVSSVIGSQTPLPVLRRGRSNKGCDEGDGNDDRADHLRMLNLIQHIANRKWGAASADGPGRQAELASLKFLSGPCSISKGRGGIFFPPPRVSACVRRTRSKGNSGRLTNRAGISRQGIVISGARGRFSGDPGQPNRVTVRR
jgi:hypothetical protein